MSSHKVHPWFSLLTHSSSAQASRVPAKYTLSGCQMDRQFSRHTHMHTRMHMQRQTTAFISCPVSAADQDEHDRGDRRQQGGANVAESGTQISTNPT